MMNDNDIFVNAYVQSLNAVPSSTFPSDPEIEMQEQVYDGVSKDVLDIHQLEQKLNDVNTALTNFEVKSNEWHDFLLQTKDSMDVDTELFKQYETDQATTLASINKIKDHLIQIKNELTTLKDTLKQ